MNTDGWWPQIFKILFASVVIKKKKRRHTTQKSIVLQQNKPIIQKTTDAVPSSQNKTTVSRLTAVTR